jgi:hypothetical protein
MFGLMKTRICSQRTQDRETRRLAYCGTCKTLGAAYGQRARLLLNHDAVFLAELMEALEPAAPDPGPHPAFRSYSCLALPAIGSAVPIRLRYAAAATVFLAEARVADRREDSPSPWVEVFARVYGGAFRNAGEELSAFGAPAETIRVLLGMQVAREEASPAAREKRPAAAVLASLAEPTAQSTALFFGHGARLAGRPGAEEAMEDLGRAFGRLVYLLDAFEDYEKDGTRREFNAFRTAYELPAGPLSGRERAALRQVVWSAGVETADRIEALPISAERRLLFASRLRSNLLPRLEAGERPVHSCGTSSAPESRGRLLSATGRARAIASASLVTSSNAVRALLTPLLVLLAFPLALFLPSWASPARGLGESLGLALNLMFAGGVVRALLSPLRFAAAGPRVPPPPIPGAPIGATRGHGKEGEGGGGCCCDGCCDSCDCGDCCSGCDC